MVVRKRTLDLDVATLYAILRLRAEVFVVEQACPYLDVDGRDVEPAAEQLWLEGAGGSIVATARLLEEPDGSVRLGRICTTPAARGRGLAAQLVEAAVQAAGGRSIVLDAQSHLVPWYETLGFAPTGHQFVEDGIPHTEMARAG